MTVPPDPAPESRPPNEGRLDSDTLFSTNKKLECKWPRRHVWKIVKKEELKSSLDVMRDRGVTKFKGWGWETWSDLAHRPHLITYKCERCGSEKVNEL